LIGNRSNAWRQICSGFILSTSYHFKYNPKLDALMEVVEQAIETSKIVIFHEFIMEGEMVEKRLKNLKIDYRALNGRTKDKGLSIKEFETKPKIKVMIAHPLSGGSSIDLLSAAHVAFFSNGRKVIDRKQCMKRVHRGGQKSERVWFWDFICPSTIEKVMLTNLRNGINAFDRYFY